ncbi:MAG: cupin domain-containing protein [Anaerolineales bacterium]|jgi:quercetin dioxygenase-like cupin family protein
MVENTVVTKKAKVLASGEGLRLPSGPGRDLIFKVTGEDTGGAFDYFVVDVAPNGGPPLHVHYEQEETIHVSKGRYKVQIGDEIYYIEEGGFAYMPSNLPHTFLNLTDQPGKIIVVYTPGGGHKFYEEFGPIARMGPPDPEVIGPLFNKYDMALLGPPLTPD